MTYLPSRKFTVVIVSITLVGSSFWYLFARPNNIESSQNKIAFKSNKEDDAGALEWAANLEKTGLFLPSDSEGNAQPVTDGLLKNFADSYLTTGKMDTETQEKIINDAVLGAVEVREKNKDKFSASDITIDNSESVKNYLNNVGSIIQKYFPDKPTDPQYENEITVIFNSVANEEAFAELPTRLQKYIYRYRAAAEELKKVKTPTEAIPVQLGFLNSFSNTAAALAEISSFQNDLMVGMVGMREYMIAVNESKKVITEAKALATKFNVVFHAGEPGEEFQYYFDKI